MPASLLLVPLSLPCRGHAEPCRPSGTSCPAPRQDTLHTLPALQRCLPPGPCARSCVWPGSWSGSWPGNKFGVRACTVRLVLQGECRRVSDLSGLHCCLPCSQPRSQLCSPLCSPLRSLAGHSLCCQPAGPFVLLLPAALFWQAWHLWQMPVPASLCVRPGRCLKRTFWLSACAVEPACAPARPKHCSRPGSRQGCQGCFPLCLCPAAAPVPRSVWPAAPSAPHTPSCL